MALNHGILHQAILRLYRGCRDEPAERFKEWAMELAAGLIRFDSGIWVTADVRSRDFKSIYLFHQPPEMMENYVAGIMQNDFLLEAILASPGKTICRENLRTRAEIDQHITYEAHCRPYKIEQALATYHRVPVVGINTFISFYRSDRAACFSEAEREMSEFLVPHLIEAMRINLFTHIREEARCKGSPALAVCDSEGRLYEATPQFGDLLAQRWPNWSGPQIPLGHASNPLSGSDAWTVEGIDFVAQPCHELFLIEARPSNGISRLSQRQLAIAERLARGMKYKEIAKELGISPSTVTNHANQIYARLEISGRGGLIELLNAGA